MFGAIFPHNGWMVPHLLEEGTSYDIQETLMTILCRDTEDGNSHYPFFEYIDLSHGFVFVALTISDCQLFFLQFFRIVLV